MALTMQWAIYSSLAATNRPRPCILLHGNGKRLERILSGAKENEHELGDSHFVLRDVSTEEGEKMKRAKVALLVTLCGLVVASCASRGLSDALVGADSANGQRGLSTDGQSESSTEHVETSLPPVGDFDPNDPDFVLFDPCNEISEASLQRAELGPPKEFLTPTSKHMACSFEDLSGVDGYNNIIVNSADWSPEELNGEAFKAIQGDLGVLDGARIEAFRLSSDEESKCQPAVETVRGTVFLNVIKHSGETKGNEACLHGARILKAL